MKKKKKTIWGEREKKRKKDKERERERERALIKHIKEKHISI